MGPTKASMSKGEWDDKSSTYQQFCSQRESEQVPAFLAVLLRLKIKTFSFI